jgi:hypothetical protein
MAPKKGSQIIRFELEVVELLEAFPEVLQKLNNAWWFEFCCALQGYHEDISMLFDKAFQCF